MTRQEITDAADGIKVNAMPSHEIREMYLTGCKRLCLQSRQTAHTETLEYIINQIYQRHTYTAAEFFLAIDYFNAGELDWKIGAYETFGLSQIMELMAAYRTIKHNFTRHDVPAETNEADRAARNEQAAADICRMIFEGYKAKGYFETSVMMLWKIAYAYLAGVGKVSEEDFAACYKQAEKHLRADMLRRGKGASLDKHFKIGMDIELFQAQIVVDKYMKSLIK